MSFIIYGFKLDRSSAFSKRFSDIKRKRQTAAYGGEP